MGGYSCVMCHITHMLVDHPLLSDGLSKTLISERICLVIDINIVSLFVVFRYEMACSNTAMIKNDTSSQDSKLDRSSCILHSYLEGNNIFGQNSVTEYGWLGKGSSIGNNSIVSNVFVSDGLALPDDSFVHTVCVKAENGEKAQFVTVTFGIKDNLKKTCSDARSSSELKLHQKSLDKAMELLGYPKVN